MVIPASTSRVYRLVLSLGLAYWVDVPNASIRVDGAEADWLEVHTRYSEQSGRLDRDSMDAVLSLATDGRTLFLNWRDGSGKQANPYIPAEICLDLDENASTGHAGSEACAKLGDPQGNSGPVPVPIVKYTSAGKIRLRTAVGMRAPVIPGFTQSCESGIPIEALGLDSARDFRFIVRYGGIGKAGTAVRYLKDYATIASTRMRYRPGAAMTVEGLEDGWENADYSWTDPVEPAVPPRLDLVSFKLASDSLNLYVYFRTYGAWADSSAPRLRMVLRQEADSLGKDPPRQVELSGKGLVKGQVRDWSESAIPWKHLGIGAGARFRFVACIEGGNCLQGYQRPDSSRLLFPSRTVYLGAQMFGLKPEELDSVLDAYSDKMMDGRTFRSGKYFNVQLAIHGEEGSDMASAMPAPHRYDFRILSAVLEKFRSHRIAYFPLIQYHYLPQWFQPLHDSLYGQTRPVERKGGTLPPGNAFMPVIPDSPGYRQWAVEFTREAVQALHPYLGATVPMILTGNEVAYPGSRSESYSFDTAFTLKAWRSFRKDPRASFPVGATPEFCRFRSQSLIGLLSDWTRAARRGVDGLVPVSTKLVPYGFLCGEFRQYGYYPHVFEYLDQAAVKSIAVDAYPPDGPFLQAAYRLGKPMAIMEYSHSLEGRKEPTQTPSSREITGWMENAVGIQGMTAGFFFSWNSTLTRERIYPEQLRGIRESIGRVLLLDKPAPRTRLIRGYLPVGASILTGDMGMAHPDVIARLSGWVHAAATIQAKNLSLAFELGVQDGPLAPDVKIRGLENGASLTPERVRFGKVIYLLPDSGTHVRIGKYSLKTAGPEGNEGNSDCRLTNSLRGQPSGSLLMSWTPGWFRGSKYLVTDLPDFDRDSALGVRILARAEGKPMVIRVGRRSVFLAGDLFWHIGQSRGDPASLRFLSNLILTLLEE